MDVYTRLKELNIELGEHTPLGGIYTSVREYGKNMVYTSGTSANNDVTGKLGRDLTLEQGMEQARLTMLNILSNLHHDLKNLNRIKRFVKILAFVASADDFYQQPQVVNGASALLKEIFGDEVGLPARSAIGVNVLPGNIPIEIEVVLELKDDND